MKGRRRAWLTQVPFGPPPQISVYTPPSSPPPTSPLGGYKYTIEQKAPVLKERTVGESTGSRSLMHARTRATITSSGPVAVPRPGTPHPCPLPPVMKACVFGTGGQD